MLSDIHMTE